LANVLKHLDVNGPLSKNLLDTLRWLIRLNFFTLRFPTPFLRRRYGAVDYITKSLPNNGLDLTAV
jgi:hypothetical protein